ncbi:hypothetical protein ACLOJK_000937 [Asimina triloba]
MHDGYEEQVNNVNIPEKGVEQVEQVIQEEEHVEPRRSTGERRLLQDIHQQKELECIEDVNAHKEKEKWQQAM